VKLTYISRFAYTQSFQINDTVPMFGRDAPGEFRAEKHALSIALASASHKLTLPLAARRYAAPLRRRRHISLVARELVRSKLPRAGFDELGIDWGPASPFGSDDDPGTPMTHQDSSESDELRPDLFAPGAAPLPAPEPVVTPAANAQPERPVAPFVRALYSLLEGPYDETLCEWLCGKSTSA